MDLLAFPLSVFLLDELGPGYLAWTSEALYEELTDRFGTVGVATWEKIQALRILQAHDAYWKEWEVFEKVTVALMGEPPIFSFVQTPEAEELAISLSIAKRINNENAFDEDVLGYIASACLNDGLWYLEDPLNIAEPALSEYDRRLGVKREWGQVAGALQNPKTVAESEDPVQVQVNRVLDVRIALSRYWIESDKQLRELPNKTKVRN